MGITLFYLLMIEHDLRIFPIQALLSNIVSRLAISMENYKKIILNPDSKTKYDIPFAKVYKNLLQQYPTENLNSFTSH